VKIIIADDLRSCIISGKKSPCKRGFQYAISDENYSLAVIVAIILYPSLVKIFRF
jgi:hypothetical protein